MKILICGMMYLPELNGQSIFTANLAEGMAARGHQVRMLMPGKQHRTRRYTLNGVEVVQLPALHLGIIHDDLRLSLFTERFVRRELDQYHPDIIHVQDPSPLCQTVVAAGHRRGIPVAATHHPGPEITAPYLMKSRPWIKHSAETVAWDFVLHHLNQADMVTVPSRSSAAMLAAHGLDKSAWPVSCGTRLDDFAPKPDLDRAAVRARYGLDADSLLLVYVGRIDIEKNINVLAEAMALLPDDSIQLAIAGSGALDAQLRRFVTQHGLEKRVRLLGKVAHEDLPELINSADVFTMPGDAESFSIATLEGMACGKPILAANASALPELVTHGVNGYLFSARDAQDAARWITCLGENRARLEAMGRVSAERAQQHRLEAVIMRYEQIYQHTCRLYAAPRVEALAPPPAPAAGVKRRRPLILYRVFTMLTMLMVFAASFSFGISASQAETMIKISEVPALDLTEIRDLLVISHQSGDEISGAGGVIQAVLEKGGSVRILVVPSKDAQPAQAPSADAASSSDQAHAALVELGVPEDMIQLFEITSSTDEAPISVTVHVNQPAGAGGALKNSDVVAAIQRETSLFDEIKRLITEFKPDTILMPQPEDSNATGEYLNRVSTSLDETQSSSLPQVFSYLTSDGTSANNADDSVPAAVEQDGAQHWFRYNLTDLQAQQKALASQALSGSADSNQTWMNELFYQVPVQEWTLLEDAGSPSAAGGSNTLVHTWLQNYSMQAGGATDNDLIEFHAAMLGRNLCVSANAFAQPFKGKDEPTQRKSLGACLKFVEVNQRQALYINTWVNKPADVYMRRYVVTIPLP